MRTIPADVDAARRAATTVRNAGFAVPPWEALSAAPPPHPNDGRLPDPARGWQRAACHARDNAEFAALLSTLDTAGRALMLSQAGTHASRAITAFPTASEFRFENPLFRILLLRRLRLPLPPTAHTCSCRRPLDALGDHRAACAQAGVLRSRAVPLERALARICREAGARVATNVPLSRMNLDAPILDHRTIEVLANGLPLFHGAQLAVDTTLVSPVGRDGTALLLFSGCLVAFGVSPVTFCWSHCCFWGVTFCQKVLFKGAICYIWGVTCFWGVPLVNKFPMELLFRGASVELLL